MNIYFAAVSAYLSILLARILKQNGRVLNKLDEGFKLIAQLIVEKNDQTKREILDALAKK